MINPICTREEVTSASKIEVELEKDAHQAPGDSADDRNCDDPAGENPCQSAPVHCMQVKVAQRNTHSRSSDAHRRRDG